MKINLTLAILISTSSTLLLSAIAHAEDGPDPITSPTDKKASFSFTFEPSLLDSRDSTSTTLGFKYKFEGELLAAPGKHNHTVKVGDEYEQRWSKDSLSYSGSGVVAADAERNPENLLDFALALKGEHGHLSSQGDATHILIYSYSAFLKYETDQSFKNKQSVYGGQIALTTGGLFRKDQFYIRAGYGQVSPGEDKERQAALGTTTLKSFYRAEYFMDYFLDIGADKPIHTVDFIYRSYNEVSAPAVIRAAGLDHFQLVTLRLGLGNQLFVAYSSGKVPFDKQNDDILKVGFRYKLK